MASCQKCGRHVKRRKGVGKCKHCGILPWNGIGEKPVDNLTVNGKSPANAFGSCFDAAAHNLLGNYNDSPENMVMCHGIGISNYPGEEGKRIAHAWIEFDHPKGRVAFDPIYLIAQSAEIYRRNFKAEIVIEYTKEEFIGLWEKNDYPGPFDERILSLTRKVAA